MYQIYFFPQKIPSIGAIWGGRIWAPEIAPVSGAQMAFGLL